MDSDNDFPTFVSKLLLVVITVPLSTLPPAECMEHPLGPSVSPMVGRMQSMQTGVVVEA